jgi:hypothetical protein
MAARAELTPAGATPLHAALAPFLTLSIARAIKSGRQKQLLVWQSSESQPSMKGFCAHVGSSVYSGVSYMLKGRLLPIITIEKTVRKMNDKDNSSYLKVRSLRPGQRGQ